MTKRRKIYFYTLIFILILIGVAVFFRFVSPSIKVSKEWWMLLGLLRSLIYIVIFSIWGFFLYWRVIQKKLRNYLISIDFMILFLLSVRTIKYFFLQNIDQIRYFWYLYYLPFIFIPVYIFLATLMVARPGLFKNKQWVVALHCFCILLFLFVFTNDFHQLVFSFSSYPYTDHDYKYEIGFFLVILWEYFFGFLALVVLFKNTRILQNKKRILTPMIPIFMMIIYQILYAMKVNWLKFLAGDQSVVQSLLIALSIEICIQCGFVQTNIRYKDFFYTLAIPAVIVDKNYREYIASEHYESISKSDMIQVEHHALILENGIRLSCANIKGGYVFWEEDIHEFIDLIDELHTIRENLNSENEILKENYKIEKRIHALAEQNHLYDELHKKISDKIKLLRELIENFQNASSQIEKQTILKKMMVLGVYIKRSSNLIFIAEQNQFLKQEEVVFLFKETLDNLKLSNIECAYYIHLNTLIYFKSLQKIYDFYENVIENIYDDIKSLLLRIYENGECFVIQMNILGKFDLIDLHEKGIDITLDEDNVYDIRFYVEHEGGKDENAIIS